ncbi:hypothetical protein BDQ17DRAFT_1180832, partial [Cyathus striatus]
MWTASNIVSGPPVDGRQSCIPSLMVRDATTHNITHTAISNLAKSKLFQKTFFPQQSTASKPPVGLQYLPPRWTFLPITDTQLHCAISKINPSKATCSGSVPNCVIKHCCSALVPFLAPLFRGMFTLDYYPEDWARTEMIVLKKPGKSNYSDPSSWHPIVLSNGLAHLLNAVVAEEISTMCECLHILPHNHFG